MLIPGVGVFDGPAGQAYVVPGSGTFNIPSAGGGESETIPLTPARPTVPTAWVRETLVPIPAHPTAPTADIRATDSQAFAPAHPTAPIAWVRETVPSGPARPTAPAALIDSRATLAPNPARPTVPTAWVRETLVPIPAHPTAPAATIVAIGRTITDADYAAWLAGDHPRCLLIEMKCWHAGAETTRYVSNLGYMSGPYDIPANQPYDDILAASPQVSWSIDAALTAQAIELINTDAALDAWIDDGWDGRQARFLLGDPNWALADFRLIFTGVLDGIASASPTRLALGLRDKMELLNKPVQSNLLTTGPHANTPVPLLFGRCFNVEPPVVSDTLPEVDQLHDGAIQAISEVREDGLGGDITIEADTAHGQFTLSRERAGRITVDAWGVGVAGSSTATGLAAWTSALTWTLGHPITGASAVRYGGAAVSGYAVANSSGSVTLPASLFTVVADYIGPAPSANLTGTCDGTARFTFPTLAQHGGAYAQSIANVRIASTPASATPDLVDCAVTLAHPLPLTVEFLMYNRYDSPEDAGAYWLTATHVSGNTYRVALNFSGQYVAQVNVGGVELTDLVIDVPPGLDPAQTDVDLDNLTGLTVTADVVRFQATPGAAMDYVSGLTWELATGTVLGFTEVRLDGASVAYSIVSLPFRRVALADPPGGTVEVDFSAQDIDAASVVRALATRDGLLSEGDLDLDAFDAFRALQPAPVGWFQTNAQRNAIECIDEILAAVGGQRHFTRFGLLRPWRLDAPTGTAVAEFDADDVAPNGLRLVKARLPAKRVRVGVRRNWTVQDAASLAADVSSADRARYAADYLDDPAVAENAGIGTAHPNALEPDLYPGLFVERSAAQAEAGRRAGLASVVRHVFEADLYARALGRELGDEIRLTYPRYGFEAGANAIIVGINERPGEGRVTLTLWR